MKEKIKNFIFVCLVSIIPTLLIWLPFFLRLEKFWTIPLGKDGMATIVANYDGPLYIVVAKSLYNTEVIKLITSFPLPIEYYAAHFPLYPILIRLASPLLGFPYAMLFVTLVSSIFSIYFFYKLSTLFVSKEQAKWLTFIFSIFPARWLIARSIGSPEPLFVGAIIASVYYFKERKYFLAALMGAIAQLTKSPAILLFIAYFIIILIRQSSRLTTLEQKKKIYNFSLLKYAPLILIPFSLLIVFTIYQFKFNDFLAYFHSGDNIHLSFPPFQVFNYSSYWVGTFWLEEIIFIYIISLWGIIKLLKNKEIVLGTISAIFFTSIIFVAHRDIIRYLLPAIPFLILAYKDTLLKKEFKFVLFLIIIPIYLFALGFISQNRMPIADWAPLL